MSTIYLSIMVISLFGLAFGVILEYIYNSFFTKKDLMVKKANKTFLQNQCSDSDCHSCEEKTLNKNNYMYLYSLNKKKEIQEIITLLNVDMYLENKYKKNMTRMIAIINEKGCIGCTKCTQVCPVDAIIGSTHVVHVIIENVCIGCNRCVLSCPMQCIDIYSIPLELEKLEWNIQAVLNLFCFSR